MKNFLILLLLLPTLLFAGQSRLRDGYCNDTLVGLNTPIYAKIVAGGIAYKFNFYNPNTGQTFEYEKNATNTSAGGVTYAITLGYPQLIPYAFYNTTYEVKVKVNINGTWESDWGPTCLLTTPVGSKVIDSDQGKVINYQHYQTITFENCPVTGLEDYQARCRVNGTTVYYTAVSGTEASPSSTDKSIMISDFMNLGFYGKILRISVRVKVNGVWSNWGNERVVSVVSSPVTKLCDGTYNTTSGFINHCGSSFNNPFIISSTAAILTSYNLYGFSSSTFEVTKLDASGNPIQTETHTRLVSQFGALARAFRLNMIPSFSSGVNNITFKIRVKTNLGNFGDPCYVRVQNSIAPKPDVVASPNPFTTKFKLNNDSLNVEIYNMSGQLMEKGNSSVELGEYLPTGIYFIKIEDEVIKVIKE